MGIWDWWKQRKMGSPQPIDDGLAEQVQALCKVLRELIEILSADQESHWRDWMSVSLAALEENDLRGVEHLRSAYGGMGSFNDLVIGQRMQGGEFSWTPDAGPANDRLSALRTEAYGLISEILSD
jgi:hypothetical protein